MKSKQRNIIIFAVLLLILLYYRRQAAAAANQAATAIRNAVNPSPPNFVPGGFGTPEQVAEAGGDLELSRGSEGDYVSALQTWLNGQGAGLTVDGKFGPKTEGALISIFGSRTINISDFIEGPFLG